MASKQDVERFRFLCEEIATRIREYDSLNPTHPDLADADKLLRELAKCSARLGVPIPVSVEINRTAKRNEAHITIQHVGDMCKSESGILWSANRETGEMDASEVSTWRQLAAMWLDRWKRHVGSEGNLLLDLTAKEKRIVETVGDGVLTGQEIADQAGYERNSWFRQTLSNLVKRGYLVKGKSGQGYRRP